MARRIAYTPPPDLRHKGASRGGPKRPAPPPKKHRTDPKVRARAEELSEGGMPFQMAMAVALGRVSLNDALERLQRQDKVQKTMDQHDLSRALATQIVIGHASLETVLARRRLQAHREENRMRSCLDDARDTHQPIALALHDQKKIIGTVVEVAPYSVTIQPDADEDPVEIHKLQLKYAWDPDEWKKVRKGLKTDKALSKDPKSPIERPQDRYTCSDKRLFRYMDQQVQLQVTLLEGEQFRGTVDWFGRYEFGLQIKGGGEVTVFRHCLADISEV